MTMARSNFNVQLERVPPEDTFRLATRVEEDLLKAIQSLRDRDEALAAWVKADDRTVNAMQERVQYLTAILMATQQPVAQDLRELVSAIRLADNLERMGDYAVHLAKTAIKMKDSSWPRQFEMLGEMAEIGSSMVRAMIDAYMRKDVDAAASCAGMDARVDELHHRLMALTMDGLKAIPPRRTRRSSSYGRRDSSSASRIT